MKSHKKWKKLEKKLTTQLHKEFQLKDYTFIGDISDNRLVLVVTGTVHKK